MRRVCDYMQLIDEDKLGLNPIKQIYPALKDYCGNEDQRSKCQSFYICF